MLDHTMRVQMQLDSLSTTDFVDVISRFFAAIFLAIASKKLETAAKCEI
ncbi:hypothetical protein [Vibrio parahaemolyticus]|nr:hypothetical protein [Vibrio parahaemolyticus]